MPYIQNAAGLIIETLLGLYLIAVILRFLFQLFRVDFHNPISQAIVRVTNSPLRLLRRFIPGLFGIDMASVVLILIVGFVKTFLLLTASGSSLPIPSIVLLVVAEVINVVCWILLISIIGSAIVSWVAPYSRHPAIVMLRDLSDPVMAPFRRIMPNLGGLDISPIFAILAIQLVQNLAVTPLRHQAMALVGG